MYLKNVTTKSTRTYLEDIKLLKEKIENADAIINRSIIINEDINKVLDDIMEPYTLC